MKLDLIIPVYNNRNGLCRTLMSIGTLGALDIFVTIVNDGSTEQYEDLVDIFQHFFHIRVLNLKTNGGPAVAREFGLQHTYNEYAMFVDCGDYFTSPTNICYILDVIKNHPDVKLFSFAHDSEYGYNSPKLNKLQGKVFKKRFIIDDDIHFCDKYPYFNEDIGFMINCLLQLNHESKIDKKDYIYYDDRPVIFQSALIEEGSITKTKYEELYYGEQNISIFYNIGYALEHAAQRRIPFVYIMDQITSVMIDMYFHYISTVYVRPDLEQQALKGALLFYKKYFRDMKDYDLSILVNKYYILLNEYLESEPILKSKFITMNFLDFLNILEQVCAEETPLPEFDPKNTRPTLVISEDKEIKSDLSLQEKISLYRAALDKKRPKTLN